MKPLEGWRAWMKHKRLRGRDNQDLYDLDNYWIDDETGTYIYAPIGD